MDTKNKPVVIAFAIICLIFALFLAFDGISSDNSFVLNLISGFLIANWDSPTPDNASAVGADWAYINITSDDNLSFAKLQWSNSTGITNISMSNVSMTDWYVNMTGLSDNTYNYTIWIENTTGALNQTELRFVEIDTVVPAGCDYEVVSLPYTITDNDSIYCLDRNLYLGGATAITFAAGTQNTTLDCKGYVIDGDDTNPTSGVFLTGVNTKNNIIENCYLTDFSYGIYLNYSSGNQISKNTISSYHDAGINMDYSNNTQIIDNVISDSDGYDEGIRMDYSDNNIISNNTIYSPTNGDDGIDFYYGVNNTIMNNNITTDDNGFEISYINNSFFENNSVVSGNIGINVRDYSYYNSFIENNIQTNNSGYESVDLGYNDAYNNMFKNNKLYSDIYSTVRIHGVNNTFISDTFFNEGSSQIELRDSTSWFIYNNETDGNIWLKTNPSVSVELNRTLITWSTSEMAWNDTSSVAVTMTYNLTGLETNTDYIIYNNLEINDVIQTDSEGALSFDVYFASAEILETQEISVEQLIVPAGCDYLIYELPYTITDNDSIYCLDRDLVVNTEAAIIFTTGIQNTTLDCNGYRVDGMVVSAFGVDLGGGTENNTVKNCEITNFNDGIYLTSQTTNNYFINNTLTNNSNGFYSDAQISTIINGSIHDNNYDYVSEFSTAIIQAINTNFTEPRLMYYDVGNIWFNYNDDGGSIWLNRTTSNSTVITRTLINWNQTLMQWNESSSVTITATYNISGMFPDTLYKVYTNSTQAANAWTDSEGAMTFDLDMAANTDYEIAVKNDTFAYTYDNCDINITTLPYTITQNNYNYCLNSDLSIDGLTAITFGEEIQNTTLDCKGYVVDSNDTYGTYGVFLTGVNTKDNIIENCYLTDFSYGIYLNYSSGNLISQNIIYSYHDAGLNIDYSNNTQIIDNVIFFSDGYDDGMRIEYSDNIIVLNNTVYSPIEGDDGIDFYYGVNHTILNNNITARSNGLEISYLNNSFFENNSVVSGFNGIEIRNPSYYNLFIGNNIHTDNGGYESVSMGFNDADHNMFKNNKLYSDISPTVEIHGVNNTFIGDTFFNQGSSQIALRDSTSWFIYNNETDGDIWLKTNPSVAVAINRTLTTWSTSEMAWNDTSSVAVTMTYNLTGLETNTDYIIYNNLEINDVIQTDSEGALSFDVYFASAEILETQEISVEQLIVPAGCDHLIYSLPYIITDNNSIYCLNQDFMVNTEAAITFATGIQNTTLDCMGYRIDGMDVSAFGVDLGGGTENNTVKNCEITNFNNGIYLTSQTTNNYFINNTLTNNVNGIYSDAQISTIINGTIHDNNYDYVSEFSTAIIQAINTNFTEPRLMYYDVGNIWFNYNDDGGSIWLNRTTSGSTVITRTLVNWNQTLLQWDESSSVTITATYNLSGMFPDTLYKVYTNSTQAANAWTDSDGDMTFDLPMTVNTDYEISVKNDTFAYTYDNCDINITSLPYTITQNNYNYCLNSDLSIGEVTAIIFGGGVQNTTLDCKGYVMHGDDTFGSYGIFLTGVNTKDNIIENCHLTDFAYGIYLNYSSGNLISQNAISSYSSDGGLTVYYSNNTQIINNVISFSDGYDDAIRVDYSDNIMILNNTVYSPIEGDDGIDLYYGINHTIKNNNITTDDNGLEISYINDSLFENNSVVSGYNGIDIRANSYYNLFVGNNIHTDNWGYESLNLGFNDVYDTMFKSNTLYSNPYSTIRIHGLNNTFVGDTFFNEGGSQIEFIDSTTWFIYNNETDGDIWLKTNPSGTLKLNRTLTTWSASDMAWDDISSVAVNMTYNLTGLDADSQYLIFDNDTLTETLQTDIEGALDFVISYSGAEQHTIYVARHRPIMAIESPSNKTYNVTPTDFNITVTNFVNDTSWCGYSLDNAANITMDNDTDTHFYAEDLSITDGEHSITFVCNDTENRQNDVTISFTYTAPMTCSDSIQNQGETGIDCGGPCSACPDDDEDGDSQGGSGGSFIVPTDDTDYDDDLEINETDIDDLIEDMIDEIAIVIDSQNLTDLDNTTKQKMFVALERLNEVNTRLEELQDMDVEGIDIAISMLELARQAFNQGDYDEVTSLTERANIMLEEKETILDATERKQNITSFAVILVALSAVAISLFYIKKTHFMTHKTGHSLSSDISGDSLSGGAFFSYKHPAEKTNTAAIAPGNINNHNAIRTQQKSNIFSSVDKDSKDMHKTLKVTLKKLQDLHNSVNKNDTFSNKHKNKKVQNN